MPMQAPEIREIAIKLKTIGEELRAGQLELKLASELANIYGKELKAQSLIMGERILEKDERSRVNPIAHDEQPSLPQ